MKLSSWVTWKGRKKPTKTKLWNSMTSFLSLQRHNIYCRDYFSGDGTAAFSLPKNGGEGVQARQRLVRLLASDWKMDGQRLWWWRWNWAICFFFFSLDRLQSAPHLQPQACGSHGLVEKHKARPPHKLARLSLGLQFKRSWPIRLFHLNVSRPFQS